MTLNIGVAALVPAAGDTETGAAERLLRIADAALYEAKQAGRNCVIPGQEGTPYLVFRTGQSAPDFPGEQVTYRFVVRLLFLVVLQRLCVHFSPALPSVGR